MVKKPWLPRCCCFILSGRYPFPSSDTTPVMNLAHPNKSGREDGSVGISAQRRFPGGYSDPHGVCLSTLFLLSRIGLAISVPLLPVSDAVHCNRLCSAVQPSTQCTASVLAVHCILHANICNLSRKRLQPFPQTFATAPANVCGERRSFRNLSPMIFY